MFLDCSATVSLHHTQHYSRKKNQRSIAQIVLDFVYFSQSAPLCLSDCLLQICCAVTGSVSMGSSLCICLKALGKSVNTHSTKKHRKQLVYWLKMPFNYDFLFELCVQYLCL